MSHMRNICGFFEDEERLKGRHVLIENYKAILYPNSQDSSLKTPLHNKCVQQKQVNAHFLKEKQFNIV